MDEWTPAGLRSDGPRYLAIVEALQADIERGTLRPGSRLLPHRDLAEHLGLSIGTVSKAYAEAERQGLIVGKVGKGTFVRARSAEAASSDAERSRNVPLDLNVPPPGPEIELLAAEFASLPDHANFAGLFDYLPHQGLLRHREAAAAWMGPRYKPDPDMIQICHGAQHAMSLAFSLVVRAGDTVLTESLTYSGMKALGAHLGVKLAGVPTDHEGLIPEALDEACRRSHASVLYTMPTLHSPTAATMSPERRAAIAEVARRRKLTVIEDNVYNFLAPDAPPPLKSLIPDQCFYVTSLSKCIAPGLRVGFVVAPPTYRDRLMLAIRATAWMATPAMVEIGCRMIESGKIWSLVEQRRSEAVARRAVTYELLGGHLPPLQAGEPAGFHLWLPLPPEWPAARFVHAARQRGVDIAPPEAVSIDEASPNGVRICLGGPEAEAILRKGLAILQEMLHNPSPSTLSFV